MNRLIGLILIALGILGIAWGGFSYKTRESVIDLGPLRATREKSHNIPVPPIAGGLALAGGIALLVLGGKK